MIENYSLIRSFDQYATYAPYLPPPPPKKKKLHTLCFSFLLDITAVPREIANNAHAKIWGANKMHYGRCKWRIEDSG